MTEQTITTQFEQPALDAAKPKQPRQLIRFTFYKLDAQWQLLTAELRQQGKQELLSIFEEYEQGPLMRSYGLYGVRSDCDFMLWQAAYEIEDLQGVSSKSRRSVMGKYLFVYPFVKTRSWYALPVEDRKRMMNEHIRLGLTFPSVSLNTTYSFGLDDQEFVVAFETDVISDFLDLVQQLRETEASRYTLRDTPMFTCVAQPLHEILEAIGA